MVGDKPMSVNGRSRRWRTNTKDNPDGHEIYKQRERESWKRRETAGQFFPFFFAIRTKPRSSFCVAT